MLRGVGVMSSFHLASGKTSSRFRCNAFWLSGPRSIAWLNSYQPALRFAMQTRHSIFADAAVTSCTLPSFMWA